MTLVLSYSIIVIGGEQLTNVLLSISALKDIQKNGCRKAVRQPLIKFGVNDKPHIVLIFPIFIFNSSVTHQFPGEWVLKVVHPVSLPIMLRQHWRNAQTLPAKNSHKEQLRPHR